MEMLPTSSAVLCAFLFLCFLLTLARVTYALYFSPLALIPGLALCKVTSLYLSYYDARLLRNETIYSWHQKYGSVIAIAPREVSFSSAPVAREIYSVAARHPKSSYFDYLSTFGFRSVFMARDPREHQKLRKRTFRCYQLTTVYKSSTVEYMRSFAKSFRDHMHQDVQQDGATINVFPRCNSYSFDNITRFTLGPHLCSHSIGEDPEARRMFEGWQECELWGPLGYSFPTVLNVIKFFKHNIQNNKGFLTGDDRLKQWTLVQLASAVEEPWKKGEYSLLQQLFQVTNEEKLNLSLEEIAEEILDNFMAAQSVVTNALIFIFWDLARHPGWQSKVRKELQSLPTEGDGLPSWVDIGAAPGLDACLQESSRIHPLASGRAERVVPVTKAYDRYIIPAGTVVSASTKALHYSSSVFPDPHTFDPNRWMQAEAIQLLAMKASFMP
ncbi:cytochrome P450 family protein [Phaeosphaeriaceae sp. PMI808]|nr:cytochrome P450 family protein [Phaeosphaeriaceae sp. PMI808]